MSYLFWRGPSPAPRPLLIYLQVSRREERKKDKNTRAHTKPHSTLPSHLTHTHSSLYTALCLLYVSLDTPFVWWPAFGAFKKVTSCEDKTIWNICIHLVPFHQAGRLTAWQKPYVRAWSHIRASSCASLRLMTSSDRFKFYAHVFWTAWTTINRAITGANSPLRRIIGNFSTN